MQCRNVIRLGVFFQYWSSKLNFCEINLPSFYIFFDYHERNMWMVGCPISIFIMETEREIKALKLGVPHPIKIVLSIFFRP